MKHLSRYTPEICAKLRQIAEHRHWMSWNGQDFGREDILDDFELSYHLHIAAEATGARAGMAPMPSFPVSFTDADGRLDPDDFIRRHSQGPDARGEWNQLDNPRRTELFYDPSGKFVESVRR